MAALTGQLIGLDRAGCSDRHQVEGRKTVARTARGRGALAVAGAAIAAGALNGTAAAPVSAEPSPSAGVISRVSVSSAGAEGNDTSGGRDISADGRYVTFLSFASNLVPGDTNEASDVFVRNLATGVTRRVSLGPRGRQADGGSFWPAVSPDGRYVAFSSYASNLTTGDTNGAEDVFVRDRLAGVTRLVSAGRGGRPANDRSFTPAVSAGGRYVAFTSFASNLVAEDDRDSLDVFVRDMVAGVTRRVSVGNGVRLPADFNFSPSISADGRYVAFESDASLVAADTNDTNDVYVRDRMAGTTRRVSVGRAEEQGNDHSNDPEISDDGRYVAFESEASNLVVRDTNRHEDVFLRNLEVGVTSRVSLGPGGRQGNGRSSSPSLSAHGRHVAFFSFASNLVAEDTNRAGDVFVRDISAGVTHRASIGPGGRQADGNSYSPAISGDGGRVTFPSAASNLVSGDTNRALDVFVWFRSLR